MPGMTKEVLRQKIMEFGETPPESWRKNQLEACLVELKDQNPEAKVHDDLLKEMNNAAKKKHDLRVFLTQKLGITITGNETISRLLSLGNQAIMEKKPPLATDVKGFGKFAPLTYQEVQEQHPDYTGRRRQTSLEETTRWQMTRYLKWVDQKKDVEKSTSVKKGYMNTSSGGTALAASKSPHSPAPPTGRSSRSPWTPIIRTGGGRNGGTDRGSDPRTPTSEGDGQQELIQEGRRAGQDSQEGTGDGVRRVRENQSRAHLTSEYEGAIHDLGEQHKKDILFGLSHGFEGDWCQVAYGDRLRLF